MNTIFSIIIALFLINCSVANAKMFEDDIDKAEKLIGIERYSQAEGLIESEIVEDPDNANNLYRAGILYLKMKMGGKAEQCFDFASIKGDTEIKTKIAKIYQSYAFIDANNNNIQSAIERFKKAHATNPELLEDDVAALLSYGKDHLNRKNENKAYANLFIAYCLKPSIGDSVSDLYFDAGNGKDFFSLELLQRSREFSPKNNDRIADLLLSEVKNTNLSEVHKNSIKQHLKQFISKSDYDKAFPSPPTNVIIYPPGSYKISLKAGETNNHWIMFPSGRKNSYDLSSSDNKFIATFSNGKSYNTWEIESFPYVSKAKILITAVTDQEIILLVK